MNEFILDRITYHAMSYIWTYVARMQVFFFFGLHRVVRASWTLSNQLRKNVQQKCPRMVKIMLRVSNFMRVQEYC